MTGNRAMTMPQLLSIAETADRLGVSPKTVRRQIAAGDLPAHRIGRRVLIDPRDLDLFLFDRRLSGGVNPGQSSQ